jgi:integrase-like protein
MGIAMMRQLLDVVHHEKELPLPSILARPRSVKRVRRLLWRRLPKTGSTVAKRAAVICLPSSESILSFIRSVWLSWPARLPWKKATCRVLVVSGFLRQRSLNSQAVTLGPPELHGGVAVEKEEPSWGPHSQSPRLLDQVEIVCARRHFSLRTAHAYRYWIRQFVLFHDKRHPREMGAH